MEINVNELAPHRPNSFLANLAQAMRSTAETAKLASIERCGADAKAYVEQIQARTADEAGAMRSASEADIATIRGRSKAQVERVSVETEQRIARRMELLQQELAESNAAIELEVKSVQERVTAFENEVTRFFDLLPEVADPTVFANMASQMPSPPDFEPKRETSAKELEGKSRAEIAAARAPLAPGTMSGAGAVRGRLYSEWYGEVERLREIGNEDDAVALLLDIVFATEAESQAEGSPVAPPAYEQLAVIYRGRADAEAEWSILDRFSRQQHAPGVVTSRLLERLASLKRQTRH